MATEKTIEIPIAEVARVEIVTEETTPKTYAVSTSDEVTLEAAISEGTEKELRKQNRIIAQLKTESLIKGYDIKLKDLVMNPSVFAIVDGGVSTFKAEDGGFEKYVGPKMGEVIARIPVTVNIYAHEKDADGETVGYLKLVCKHCKGSPASITIKDGDFYSPEYSLKSRPKTGEAPLEIMPIDELPIV